jgi:hypothetical protein
MTFLFLSVTRRLHLRDCEDQDKEEDGIGREERKEKKELLKKEGQKE